MKKYLLLSLLAFISCYTQAQLVNHEQPVAEFLSHEIYIKFNGSQSPNTDFIDINSAEDLSGSPELKLKILSGEIISIEREFKILSKSNEVLSTIYRVKLNPTIEKEELLIELNRLEYIEYAEKIPLYKISYAPSDPDYSDPQKRWHLDQVNAEAAWDISLGHDTILIAIVDDAVLTTHEDLSSNIYINTNELSNGIDDDGNGYIDDISGYDVADLDNDPNPPGSVTLSHFSHGTHVSGIAAGSSDNSFGTASLGFNSSLVPIKTMNDTNTTGYLYHAIEGVEYAIAAGVDIINMSWGSYAYSNTHKILFDVAHSAGIVCVGAAGNDYVQGMMFPAGYPAVISVGATDASNDYTYFSNWSSVIDLYAPGLDIWSPVATGTDQYAFFSGTSMSAPMVSGLCALMLANDTSHTVNSVKQCLINSAALHPSLQSVQTLRIIDAEQAVLCVPPLTNVCDGDLCELIGNGGFETPENSGIIEYQHYSAIADGSLCSWQSYIQTSDIFPWVVANNNHYASSYSPKGIGFSDVIEGVVSNIMPIVPNNMYRLEFDMMISAYPGFGTTFPYTSTDLDSVIVGLVHNDYDWSQLGNNLYLDTIRLKNYSDVPVNFLNTWSWDTFDTLDFDSYAQHYVYDFQAPADTIRSRLFIYALHITEGERSFMALDNISVKPISNYPVVVTASDTTIDVGNCVDLSVTGQVSTYYWEPQGLFADPWLQNQTVCLDSTTTFYVSVLDTNLQCFQTESITVYVGDEWQNIDENELDVKIFPNPVMDDLIIQSEAIIDKLELYDPRGKLIKTSNNMVLNVKNYSSGIYTIKVYAQGQVITKRVVKK